MENATKALLIGAGVLFAVVIITIVIFAFQNISGFYQTKQSNISEEQLAAFNTEYGAYERNLTGFELVGLINKISDFNERKNEDGYAEMSINVTITEDSSYNGNLFKAGVYKGNNKHESRDGLIRKIDSMKNFETTYTASVLSRLVANNRYNDMTDDEIINFVDKKNISDLNEFKEQLGQYYDYIEFKRAKFEFVKDDYNNGQITYLEYKSK